MDKEELQKAIVGAEIRIKALKTELMLSKSNKEKEKLEKKLKEAQYLYYWYLKQADDITE